MAGGSVVFNSKQGVMVWVNDPRTYGTSPTLARSCAMG